MYSVALNITAKWEAFTIDDYFPIALKGEKVPINPRTKKAMSLSRDTHNTETEQVDEEHLIFAHTNYEELWVMLLEKAYAKAYGGFWNIGTGGFADEALSDLTGAPSESLFIGLDTDPDLLWNRLDYCVRKKYIVTLGTKGRADIPEGGIGIHAAHAFTLLGCHVVKGERVLEIRNPWHMHREEEVQKKTNEKFKRNYEIEISYDGRFFVGLEDFIKHFNNIFIAYYEGDFILSSFRSESKSEYIQAFEIEIDQDGEYYAVLSQPDRRGFPPLPDQSGTQPLTSRVQIQL